MILKATLFQYLIFDDIESNPNIIALRNKHGEMRKLNSPCVICFLKFLRLKNPEEHYLRLLQLYKPWKNESELKQDNKSYEDRYKKVEDDIMCNVNLLLPSMNLI